MLILCCGHPDRGDDAAGVLVAHRLRAMGIDARVHSGEAFSLIEAWSGATEVVLVDAVSTGAPAGTVSRWDAHTASLSSHWFCCSTHSLGIAAAVGIARNLDRLPRYLWIYGIEARQFDAGSKPLPDVMRAVEEVADLIAKEAACMMPL